MIVDLKRYPLFFLSIVCKRISFRQDREWDILYLGQCDCEWRILEAFNIRKHKAIILDQVEIDHQVFVLFDWKKGRVSNSIV